MRVVASCAAMRKALNSISRVAFWEDPAFPKVVRKKMLALVRDLQRGDVLPASKMKRIHTIGARCYELRLRTQEGAWRLICRVDPAEIVAVEMFKKTSNKLPQRVIDLARRRLRDYDDSR